MPVSTMAHQSRSHAAIIWSAMPSRIVTYRPKKRAPQPKAQSAAITGSTIVTTTTKRGTPRAKPEPED